MSGISSDFQSSYEQGADYPCSLIKTDVFPFTLRSYKKRLDQDEDALFCKPALASVDELEQATDTDVLQHFTVRSLNDLHRRLIPSYSRPKLDSLLRAFFLEAPDSRSRLSITRGMLTQLLSYFQTMPEFLDFIAPFGHQIEPRDTHFSGFKAKSSLDPQFPSLKLPEVGRTGLGYQLVYNLKSVEPYPARIDHPWSIRATAAYHAFDTETGASTWMTVKGSELIKTRIKSAINNAAQYSHAPRSRSFAISMIIHLVICKWASEHWRWYINHLDDRYHSVTRPVLSMRVDEYAEDPEIKMLSADSRAATMILQDGHKVATRQIEQSSVANTIREKGSPSQLRGDQRIGAIAGSQSLFEFKNLQIMADIEEKAAEARRVLNCNRETLEALRAHYQGCWTAQHFPLDIQTQCGADFADFQSQLSSMVADASRHILNLDNLLHVLDVRRNVLNNMFTHQNILASQRQARKAQKTARDMEDMTEVMFIIARRTEKETILMRIITVVTLFFLPATFICTFLSTDIVKYSDDSMQGLHQLFSVDALKLFLELCLPLMALTLLLSYLCHRYNQRRLKQRYDDMALRLARPAEIV